MLWVLKRTVSSVSMRGSFGRPKHMFKLKGKEINAILGVQLSLSGPMHV